MQVTLESTILSYRIYAYDHEAITVAIPKQREAAPENHQDAVSDIPMWRDELHHSLIITPTRLIRDWGPRHVDSLQHEHFILLAELRPEVVLLGTGASWQQPNPDLLAPLYKANIGIEIMDTGAACRTFNVLMSDDRQVAAAIII